MDLYETLLNNVTYPSEQYVDPETILNNNSNNIARLSDDIDNISDRELGIILNDSFDHIIRTISDNSKMENVMLVKNLFTSYKFVLALKNYVGTHNLSDYNRVAINKIIYDYKSAKIAKDENITVLLKEIADIINIRDISILQGLGIPRDIVSALVNTVYSSPDMTERVKKLNMYIFKSENLEVFTEQNLIDIYSTLFGSTFMNLLDAMLLDKYPDNVLRENKKSYELYSLINLSIIDLVEHLSVDNIRTVLLHYKQMCDIYGRYYLRFDFNVSADYQRIRYVKQMLLQNNGIDIF